MNRKQRTYSLLRQTGYITPEDLAQDLCCAPSTAEVTLNQLMKAGLVRFIPDRNAYEIYFRLGQEYIVKPCCGMIDCAFGEQNDLDGAHVNIKETWPPEDPLKVFDCHVTVTRPSKSGDIITNRIHISNLHPLPVLFD